MSDTTYDILDYAANFFAFLTPIDIASVALINNQPAPNISEPFVHCDLGCGNGVSSNVMAGAYPHAGFIGVDLSSSHIDNAKAQAQDLDNQNCTFVAQSFREAAENDDIPQCDFITAHGVLGWVNEAGREDLRRFVEAKLKPGGLFLVSYNVLPNRALIEPLHGLYSRITMPAEHAENQATLIRQVEKSVKLVDQMKESGSWYLNKVPFVGKELDKIRQEENEQRIHDYWVEGVGSFYQYEVADRFRPSGLAYVGQHPLLANFTDDILSRDQLKVLNALPNKEMSQSLLDFYSQVLFRYDIFRREGEEETTKKGSKVDVLLESDICIGSDSLTPLSEKSITIGRKQKPIPKEVYDVLQNILSGASLSVNEFLEHPELKDISKSSLLQTLRYCVAAKTAIRFTRTRSEVVTQEATHISLVGSNNKWMVQDFLQKPKPLTLMSPVSGTALHYNFMEALIIAGLSNSAQESAVEWMVTKVTKSKWPLEEKGKLITNRDQLNRFLTTQVEAFKKHKLPVGLAFGVFELA